MENIKIAKNKLRNIMAIGIMSLLFLLIPLSSAQATGVNDFKDVKKTDWFYSDVDWALEKNLFKGVSANEFAPNKSITRAEFIVALHRLAGEPEPESVNPVQPGADLKIYKDVNKGSWYEKAVYWASRMDVVRGIAGGFGTNRSITREEVATMLHRYARYKNYDTTYHKSIWDFSDVGPTKPEATHEWGVGPIEWAAGAQIINGKAGNTIDPQGKTTRAEAATIFHRYMEKYGLNN